MASAYTSELNSPHTGCAVAANEHRTVLLHDAGTGFMDRISAPQVDTDGRLTLCWLCFYLHSYIEIPPTLTVLAEGTRTQGVA
jgi:hypothetical protein